ncbi:MAG: hypothetical protein E7055_18815 [Lentisphaerae bacterium]|nr:hypothetical protein [Lentisphaerota bacterium]
MVKRVLPNFLLPWGMPLSVYYPINAYRILRIRVRQGMGIGVPEGNPDNDIRLPAFYDGTYQYLKQIGIE